jgi:hypothetical protein
VERAKVNRVRLVTYRDALKAWRNEMKRNRDTCDGRLSRRAGRFAAILALMLMPVVAGGLKAQWVPFSPPDSVPDRTTHATVYDPLNDKIYMFGGTPDGRTESHVNLCQRYDPVVDTWTTMAPMPTPRGWMNAAYVRENVYIMGGYSNTGAALAVNEEYIIAADSWTNRRPLPESVMCHMTGVWRDSLVYICGGMDTYYDATRAVQVYNPFTDSWADGTPLPVEGDMGSAVIVGDTIYIPNAYNRPSGVLWGRMLRGAINPASPTQITWLWDPERLGSNGWGGTVSLRNKVYWLGSGVSLRDDATIGGWVYDPATGIIDTVPSLRLEGVANVRGPCAAARESGEQLELYQVAGTWTSEGGSRYHKLSVSPQGVGEAGSEAMPDQRLRVSTLFRNGARINYEVDRPCRATLTVYDQSGRVVRTLASGQMQAGSYNAAWDGRDQNGRPAHGGVYFCRLQAGEFTAARKMVKVE